ncbi:universal stress protein [Confluentibacter citreus]|uniref:universal stress protein n=1 Tax=Confluentibacter citreus TaxID=2007307 RepID=UPI000C28C485|nr:universal stress protein [Confluentibacter citreus]
MKTILLPTDFSKNSINAIQYAIDMFQNTNCDFYLLNVQKASSFISDDIMVMSSSTTIYQTLISAAKKSIDNIILKIKAKHLNDKHQFHSIVDYDNLIDSINQVSKIHHVDLIVMGTKGASGLEKVIFGSNTVHVMQRCHVPILAIPDNCKFNGLHKVLFTTNHLELYGVEELKWLKDFNSLYNSELEILHIKDENHTTYEVFNNEVIFKNHFPHANHNYIHINSKDVFDIIKKHIIENHIAMFAMLSAKHSFLERLFTRQPIETFGFKIDIPFLVLNKKENFN